ncbi:hypothetical protein DFH08DRAFT_1002638 [Mycena albidolilacea]|uniref:DUF6818 domain-containing protein n=1 Tax=Mycena albidolilacea TaxID=1033008 RepID=A0AAD7AQC1_9AGAR|nr:hypothetical protein DFH08DRAFT_1002638 [Mycena albidolilacea]
MLTLSSQPLFESHFSFTTLLCTCSSSFFSPMSNPTLPPFSQTSTTQNAHPPVQANSVPPAGTSAQSSMAAAFPSGIHYDASGHPWFRSADGTWIGSSHFQPANSTFGPGPSTGAHHIDPHLVPLPHEDDTSDFEPANIAKSRGLKPAITVAGARQKDKKGKKHAHSSDSDSDSDMAPAPKQRGRRKGSSNFAPNDVDKLLVLAESKLPIGGRGWKELAKAYKAWAKECGRPERDAASLESKFKQLVKKKKPTGAPRCPPEIKKAKRIDCMINEHVGIRGADDSDFDAVSSDDGVEEILGPAPAKVRTAVAHRALTPPLRRNSRLNAPELVNKFAKAFDLETQQSLQDERAQRSFQTTQFFTVNQQLRDTKASYENLRNHLAEVERARDRAEFRLEMVEHGGFGGGGDHRSRAQYILEEYPDLVRVDGHIRCERIYPEGGGCTQWFADSEDSEKENRHPSSSSSGHRSLPRSSSPSD